jgi:hypothetical protein
VERFVTVHPRYGVASLADVVPSLLAVHGVPGATDRLGLTEALAGVRRVALLLVDGLGHHLLPLAGPDAPTLADIAAGRLGEARVLTSGFPSTTPTSLVSLGTGAVPGAHGIVGFHLRLPGTDRVLTHTHWVDDPDPLRWQPLSTQFDLAAAAGIRVTVVNRPEFAGSGLTRAAYRGGTYVGATGPDEIARCMLAGLDRSAIVYGYHADLDRVGHLCGVDSAEWRSALSDVDRLLTRLVDGLPADAALLVTADHGQLDIPEDRRFDLDGDPRLRAGVRVVAGEARVRYLHTEPGAGDDVLATWRGILGSAAWVVPRAEAVAAGWFGPVPEEHLARVGDVVAACYDRYAVVATKTQPLIESQLIAYHGSFTAAEMEIPLLIVKGAAAPRG